MKSAGKARSNGLYRHIRTSKEIIRNLLNDYEKHLNLFFFEMRLGSQYHNTMDSTLFHDAVLILKYSFPLKDI